MKRRFVAHFLFLDLFFVLLSLILENASSQSTVDMSHAHTSASINFSLSTSTTRPKSYTEDLLRQTSDDSSRSRNHTGPCWETIQLNQITGKEGRNIITICLSGKKNEKSDRESNRTNSGYGDPKSGGLRVVQEILVEDDIRLKCVQPLEEKISERDYVYTFYAYEPGTEMHGIRLKNLFMGKVISRLYEIKSNFSKVSGVDMTCSYIGWPSKGVFVDYLALWVTLLAISSAALLFLAGWKAMNMYKERAAADQSSICASSITKRTCVSERGGSVNENKQGGASTAAAAAAARAANAKPAAASSTKTPAPSTTTTSNAAPKANTSAAPPPQPDASTESGKATAASKKEEEEVKSTPANNNTASREKTENEQPAIELKVREKDGGEKTEEEEEKKHSEGEDGATSSNDIANTQV